MIKKLKYTRSMERIFMEMNEYGCLHRQGRPYI